MTFYRLTDPLHRGDIIRADGRKHYRYSYGDYAWTRTSIMLAYMNEDSSLYGQYEIISAEEAQAQVIKQGKNLLRLLNRAEELAVSAYGDQRDEFGTPLVERVRKEANAATDQEQKMAIFLQFYTKQQADAIDVLDAEGFPPRILYALRLLADTQSPEYLKNVRLDSLARATKISDVNYQLRALAASGRNPGEAELCRAVLRFLELETDQLPDEPKKAFCPSLQVYQNTNRDALDGRKLPHGISNPVLRREDGNLWLAFFVHLYSWKDLDAGMLPRPSLWILTDIETGAIVVRRDCAKQDFFDEPGAARLSTRGLTPQDSAQETLRRLYSQMDDIRRNYLSSGKLDMIAYNTYLEQMLLLVPSDWRNCYRQLSRV